ncbi:MAG: AraC family ligand binding domain-containing protein [Trueperaceae bacterium]
MREHATYWQSNGLELLKATFVKHSFPPHTHDGYVIGLVEGGVEMFHREKELHVATPNKIILVNPNQLHTGYAGVPEGWTYRTLYPSIEQMQKASESIFGKEHMPYFPYAVLDDTGLAKRLHHFHCAAEQGTRLEQDSTFTDMLGVLVSCYADKTLSLHTIGKEHKAVRVAQKFLEAHPTSEVSLESLANLTSLSSFHLLRVFKRDMGVSPHGYQIQQRIELAKKFLREGKKIAEVALETGFHDQSHMGLHFKRLVGVTPMQFVKGSRL